MRVFLDKCVLMYRQPNLACWFYFGVGAEMRLRLDKTSIWKIQGQVEEKIGEMGIVRHTIGTICTASSKCNPGRLKFQNVMTQNGRKIPAVKALRLLIQLKSGRKDEQMRKKDRRLFSVHIRC